MPSAMSVGGPLSRPTNGVARSDSKLSAKALYEERKKYSQSNFIMQETSQYHVEHLSTFIMDKSESIATVDDAIKKLVLLDTKDKIWTQEMLLQVTDQAVRLLDCDTQEELENFPMSTIHLCQPVLNQTRYRSVLLLVCQDREQHHPDIHFFHCDQVEAEMVFADIDSAIGDKKHGNKMRLQTLKVNQEKMKRQRETILPPSGHRPPMRKERVSPENLAQIIEKDVQILNCALDDIEIFVARLQKAAEAFNQLNHRNKSKKNKKKAPAEGMLTLRAKPPSEADFIDSLQKLKLALNLLAKLQKHIQNPNASELVHFLFGPLELVLQSCGNPDLARSVISPHLSSETVEFLRGHLTPKEMTIFELLGDGWTKPRAEWPPNAYAPPYFPVFRNGWEPPMEHFQTAPWETETPMDLPAAPGQKSRRSSSDSRSSNGSYSHRFAKVMYSFVARNANELSVLQDEVLEVVESGKEWWKLRNRSGQVGYVPLNILEPVDEPEGQQAYVPPPNPLRPEHKPTIFQLRPDFGVMNEVNNELLMVITAQKPKPTKIHVPPKSQVPLRSDSSPEQVIAWLNSKGFSSATVECLGILTGAQLFSLNKEELRTVCPVEGNRVYSQVTAEKAKLEQCSGTSELQEVMKRQQEKINSSAKD